jgi:Flp pilus assembly pilin Flp
MAAEEDITLSIKIDAAASASTVKELRTSLKDLKNELDKVPAGSEGFKKLTKSINDTEGKLGDLNDSFNTLTGSGVERTTKSFNLLKEGFTTFDGGKIKAAFSGIGAAMKAIPIFLIVEGIRYLIENFNELTEGSGLVATILKSVAKIVEEVKGAFNDLTDAIGATNTAMDKWAENIKKGVGEGKDILDGFNSSMDNSIKLAKANGESTIKYEKAKQDAIIVTNKLIVEQYIALVEAGHKLTEEERKQITTSLQLIKTANVEKQVIDINHKKQLNDDYQKHLDEKKKLDDKAFQDYKTAAEKQDSEIKQRALDLRAWMKEQAAEDRKALETKTEEVKYFDDDATTTIIGNYDKQVTANKKAEEEKRANMQKTLDGTKQALQATQALTDMAFAHQLKMAKGNAAKETEIRKKQFQVNKAFGIVNAVVDGVGAVQKALNNPYPLNIVLAVLSGVLAAANVAKIASTKFEPDSGGSASADTGSLSAPAPVVPSPNNSTTKIKDDGTVGSDDKRINQAPVVKAVVVETDITSSQKNVNTIEESAKFG